MTNILLVGAGGFIGSILRYLLGGYLQGTMKSSTFPYGTLAVNLIGCFVIGLLAQYGESRGAFSNQTHVFIFIGILGGFTTFSAFGNETINLIRESFLTNALLNIGANVIPGLFAVWLGRTISYWIWR